jgi:hypothetical protein
MSAAMVSTSGQLVLFGGLSSANPAPAPRLFDDSWAFDGTHWTQRQDIGPAGRYNHGMAFDSARQTIVLFGGYAGTSSGQATELLGDTWEHVAEEQAPGPGPGPGPDVGLVQLVLNPTTAAPGEMVQAEVTLTGEPPNETAIGMAWVRQSVFDQSNNDGTPIPQEEVHPLPQIIVPVGSPVGTTSFPAPNPGESVVVAAFVEASSALALLTIT